MIYIAPGYIYFFRNTLMSHPTGAAAYKKKQGMLSVLEDASPPKLVWKSIDSNVEVPYAEVHLDSIGNLQATSATSKNMMLKVITMDVTSSGKPIDYVFAFSNRPTMNNIKEALQQVVARKKSSLQALESAQESAPSSNRPTPAPSEPPARQLGNDELASLLDPAQLLKNHGLQQRLLMQNKSLMTTFKEAVMNSGLDPEEFWNTRVHLLRSFAIQTNQKCGQYNVLSTIKPVASSDNQVNVSVTREKIHAIFQQYPLVRKAYDDSVPKLSEGEFWSRFFSSKLFRKLRGEKINNYDRGDLVLDKYLSFDADYEGEEPQKAKRQKLNPQVNRFIDVEGNQEDNAQKLGNSPDITMRYGEDRDINPNTVNQNNVRDNKMVPILQSMNRLSKRMIGNVNDEETNQVSEEPEELELGDLKEQNQADYNELNLDTRLQKLESDMLNKSRGDHQTERNNDPAKFQEFSLQMRAFFSEPIDLQTVFITEEAKRGIYESSREIAQLVRLNARQSNQSWQVFNVDKTLLNGVGAFGNLPIDDTTVQGAENIEEIPGEVLGLPQAVVETVRLTHSTSIEFLRHFWLYYNNEGGTAHQTMKIKAANLRKLFESLKKSQDRVNSVVESLDTEEMKGKVRQMMLPLMGSLNNAITKYTQEANQATNDET